MQIPQSIAEWHRETTGRFRRELLLDQPEAHLRARLILTEVIGTPHAHLLLPGQVLTELQSGRLEELTAQIIAGKPLAYVVGHREFYGRDFLCAEGALIPRPETELLIEEILRIHPRDEGLAIADLGTGTGCLAITLALELPGATVTATDLSQRALELATRNAARHEAEVRFLPGMSGDWITPLEGVGSLDIIVSNPPYIPRDEISQLQPEIRDFEPREALDGGTDGLDPYRDMAAHAGRVLLPGGRIYLELGAGQFPHVARVFEQNGYRVAPAIEDLSGHQRVLVAQI